MHVEDNLDQMERENERLYPTITFWNEYEESEEPEDDSEQ